MKNILKFFLLSLLMYVTASAQGFNVSTSGEQTFTFFDEVGRNQASFYSSTPLEDITGLSNDINGSVTFDLKDITTLKGTISISTASLKTGIELRDNHLKSPNWLDAESYPVISFVIKTVSNIKTITENKVDINVTGDFTAHGVTKEVTAEVSMTYLEESEKTKLRSPGDLLGVEAKFNITLSDYDVQNMVLGAKVSDSIDITVTMVGSNSK